MENEKELSTKELDALIESFAKTVNTPEKKSKKLIIVAPYGPSCIGKSTVMKYLTEKLPLVHIQNDAIRLFLRERGMDENEPLYKYSLLQRVGELFLRKGYSVILDANFASDYSHVSTAENVAKKRNEKFFLIRITAPKSYIIEKLKSIKFLPLDGRGLLPDADTAIEHFLRSSEQFDYESLMPKTLEVVDSSKPLDSQLEEVIGVLRDAMSGEV